LLSHFPKKDREIGHIPKTGSKNNKTCVAKASKPLLEMPGSWNRKFVYRKKMLIFFQSLAESKTFQNWPSTQNCLILKYCNMRICVFEISSCVNF